MCLSLWDPLISTSEGDSTQQELPLGPWIRLQSRNLASSNGDLDTVGISVCVPHKAIQCWCWKSNRWHTKGLGSSVPNATKSLSILSQDHNSVPRKSIFSIMSTCLVDNKRPLFSLMCDSYIVLNEQEKPLWWEMRQQGDSILINLQVVGSLMAGEEAPGAASWHVIL